MADPKQIADALAQDQLLAQFNRNEGQAQPWYMKPMDMEGRATFLPFKDTLPGSVMNKREFALPGLLAGAVNAFTAPGRVSTSGFDAPEEALNLATNVMGGGITTGKMMRNPTGVGGTDLALNVWHGTPHEIKGGFDLAKVGTGEGAQSYGHGIYFAESPGVAKSYAQNLADYQINPEYLAAQKRQQDFSETLAKRYKIDALIPSEEVKFNPEKFPPRVVNATKKLDELEQAAYEKARQGNLYKADIPDAAIPMMLDYDKPIRSQPQLYELVRQSITDPDLRKTFETNAESGISGANVYKNYINGKTDAERSANAAKLGITGIRYLDQNSRVPSKYTGDSAYTFAGQSFKESGFTLDDAFAGMKKAYKNADEKELKDALGVVYGEMPNKTSNFVVFKPETVEILERNGVPTRKELLQQEFDKLNK